MEFSDAGLAGLFVSATVLPGNSEIVLAAFLKAFPARSRFELARYLALAWALAWL